MKTTLTNYEWLVMSALWGKAPQTLSDVIKSMGDSVNWSYTTYATYLTKLCKKGNVDFEQKGRDKFYYAKTPIEDCLRAESKGILDKMSDKTAKRLLVCMIEEVNLSNEDKQELKDLIDSLGGK